MAPLGEVDLFLSLRNQAVWPRVIPPGRFVLGDRNKRIDQTGCDTTDSMKTWSIYSESFPLASQERGLDFPNCCRWSMWWCLFPRTPQHAKLLTWTRWKVKRLRHLLERWGVFCS